jgi:hypothetical protein
VVEKAAGLEKFKPLPLTAPRLDHYLWKTLAKQPDMRTDLARHVFATT